MQDFFKSETTKDEILIVMLPKLHKAIFKLKTVDEAAEHINLINKLSVSLKRSDIKWVEMELDFSPKIPSNTISYTNKFNGNFVCHVEDFERLYLDNFSNIIKPDHIHQSAGKVEVNGWITVTGSKKSKKDKYNKIIKDLELLVGDWNS